LLISLSEEIIAFDSHNLVVRVVKAPEEATELLKVDFDFVTEVDSLKLFRKRN